MPETETTNFSVGLPPARLESRFARLTQAALEREAAPLGGRFARLERGWLLELEVGPAKTHLCYCGKLAACAISGPLSASPRPAPLTPDWTCAAFR